jgi:hypothetical protein
MNDLLGKLGPRIQTADRRTARGHHMIMAIVITLVLILVIIANAHALGI